MSRFENDINECVAVLKKGGIILYPTDTIWGIGCDATNEKAVLKIYSLKERVETKSLIILLAEEKDISLYAKTPPEVIKENWKDFSEPLTVIYPEAKNLAANIIQEDKTIAIRIVRDEFCKELIHAFGKPIVSTSANISGKASPENFDAIDHKIKNGVDFIVQHRREDYAFCKPSRILKWDGNDEIAVIRE